MEYIYKISNLRFSFDKRDNIFYGLSLKIPLRGITIITGRNGAGKTTLCRLLTGLVKGYEGSLKLHNKELAEYKRSILEHILYVKQDLTGNLMGLTANEDLQIWQNRFVEIDTPHKAILRKKACVLVGISPIQDVPVWELSYGQKRRTMLATLPLFMDKYWIIDEPSANLDNIGIKQLIYLLQQKVKARCGALILTHKLKLFENLYAFEQPYDYAGNIFTITDNDIISI